MRGLVHKAVLCTQLIWLKKGCGSAYWVSALLWKDPVRIQIGSAIIPSQLSSLLFTTWLPLSRIPRQPVWISAKDFWSLFRIWEQPCRGLKFLSLQNLSGLVCYVTYINMSPVSHSLIDTQGRRNRFSFIVKHADAPYCAADGPLACCFAICVTQICPTGYPTWCAVERHYPCSVRSCSSTSDWIHQTVSSMMMITGSPQTVTDCCKITKRSKVRLTSCHRLPFGRSSVAFYKGFRLIIHIIQTAQTVQKGGAHFWKSGV